MEIKKLWDIILRRKWIIIQAFVLIVAIVMVGTLLQRPTYSASSNILIEQQGTQEALLRSIGLEMVSEMLFSMNLSQRSSVVAVEVMKMTTKPVLEKVIQRLDLRDWRGEPLQGPELMVANPTFFWYPLRGIAVKPHRQANILTVIGYSPEPQEAIDLCNTLAQVYIECDIESKHKETADAARFAEEQSIRAKADWNEAKRKFKEYQESEGLVDFGAEATILINKIADLRADQNILELALKEGERYQGPISDPYLIGGSTLSNAGQIGQLKSALAELESQLKSDLTKFTDNHPTVLALKQEIADLENKLLIEKQIFQESGSTRYQELEKQISEYKKRLREFPEKLYIMAQLSLQADTYEVMYKMLLDMKYRLNITEAMQISKLSVIEPAWKARIYAPNVGLNLIIAISLGLVFGFGLGFLIEYLDDTIKDGETVQTQFELPLLGTVPLISKRESRFLDTAPASEHDRERHLLVEAYNIIGYNIKLGSIDSPIKHVMVTSSAPSEGKTSISSNLGISMAMKGKRVVLIDSDFPRPNIYKIFGLSNDRGLTNLLLSENTLEEVIQQSITPGLSIITTGPKPPSTALLFESQQMKILIKELEQRFDFIIFDTPPVLTINDPVILGSYVDKTILVVAANEVSRQMIKQAVNTLRKSHNNLLGVVLNKFKTEGSHYYYYYYHYYYTSPEPGNGFKRLWKNSLVALGLKKRRRRHRTSRSANIQN